MVSSRSQRLTAWRLTPSAPPIRPGSSQPAGAASAAFDQSHGRFSFCSLMLLWYQILSVPSSNRPEHLRNFRFLFRSCPGNGQIHDLQSPAHGILHRIPGPAGGTVKSGDQQRGRDPPCTGPDAACSWLNIAGRPPSQNHRPAPGAGTAPAGPPARHPPGWDRGSPPPPSRPDDGTAAPAPPRKNTGHTPMAMPQRKC